MRIRHFRLVIFLALVATGLVMAFWQPVTVDRLLDWGEALTDYPLTIPALILLQAGLFTLALPGSLILWLIAPFQPPWISIPALLAGSVAGALGGRAFSGRLYHARPPVIDENDRSIIALLRRRGDFMTQCALRALPGFPHSVINYAGGALHLPLPTFIAAAVVGLAAKTSVYCSAVYGAALATESGDALNAWTLLPLAALTLLLLLGAALKRRIVTRKKGPGNR